MFSKFIPYNCTLVSIEGILSPRVRLPTEYPVRRVKGRKMIVANVNCRLECSVSTCLWQQTRKEQFTLLRSYQWRSSIKWWISCCNLEQMPLKHTLIVKLTRCSHIAPCISKLVRTCSIWSSTSVRYIVAFILMNPTTLVCAASSGSRVAQPSLSYLRRPQMRVCLWRMRSSDRMCTIYSREWGI